MAIWAETLVSVDGAKEYTYQDPADGSYYTQDNNGIYWDVNNEYGYNDYGVQVYPAIPSEASSALSSTNNDTFFGNLWQSVSGVLTSQQNIQSLFNQYVVPSQRGNASNVNTGGSRPTNQGSTSSTSSNTALYVIGGVLVVGMIATIIIVVSKNK